VRKPLKATAPGLGLTGAADEAELMLDINTTPLIDVMLVLLIMLIITIPVKLDAVNLDMPVAAAAPPQPPSIVTIDIDFDGTVLWNGVALADRSALEARLARLAAAPDQPEVHIRPNKLVEYKAVAMVLAAAQRLGVTKLGIVGDEQLVR
jgi:biopolymer transport protein ExbD